MPMYTIYKCIIGHNRCSDLTLPPLTSIVSLALVGVGALCEATRTDSDLTKPPPNTGLSIFSTKEKSRRSSRGHCVFLTPNCHGGIVTCRVDRWTPKVVARSALKKRTRAMAKRFGWSLRRVALRALTSLWCTRRQLWQCAVVLLGRGEGRLH